VGVLRARMRVRMQTHHIPRKILVYGKERVGSMECALSRLEGPKSPAGVERPAINPKNARFCLPTEGIWAQNVGGGLSHGALYSAQSPQR